LGNIKAIPFLLNKNALIHFFLQIAQTYLSKNILIIILSSETSFFENVSFVSEIF